MKGFNVVLLKQKPVWQTEFTVSDEYTVTEFEYPKDAPLPREGESVIFNGIQGTVNHVIHKLNDGILKIEIILI